MATFACIYAADPPVSGSLLEFACLFSPLVEETARDTVTLDLAGCDLLFGSPRGIAEALILNMAEAGIAASVAVAANPDAAIHLARGRNGVTVASAGDAARQLADLPLHLLDYRLAGIEEKRAREIFAILAVWGLYTFGDLAALPESGFSERLGPEGLKLRALARGARLPQLQLIKSPPSD